VSSIKERWEPRHVEALEAWKRGDLECLIKLCWAEIDAEARKNVAVCRGAVSLDDFAQAGREAVWKYWKNYNRKRGVPFQAFIRPHIRGAMTDMRNESSQLEYEQRYLAYETAWQWYGRHVAEGAIQSRKDDHKLVRSALQSLLGDISQHGHAQKGSNKESLTPEKAISELVRLIEHGERDESAIIEQLEIIFDRIALEEWRYVVESNATVARYFGALLGQAEFKQLPRKYQNMLVMAVEEHWKNVFGAAAKAGASFTSISGPQHMTILQRRHNVHNPSAKPLSARKLSKALGVSDKTITAWEERIEEAGPPPLLKEDGSFTLKSQQDWDTWVDYWTRIADPISWRRLHRRQQQAE
jgi:hypothetical protein